MDFSGKLSLYDFLTMLSCGFMILLIFLNIFSCEYDWNDNMIITLILSYFIGLIYHRILEFIRTVLSHYETIEKHSIFGTIFISNYLPAIKNAKDKPNGNEQTIFSEEEYYKAYYSIMDKPCYSNIKLLEAQEAFLRNITWIVVAYVVAILIYNCCNYCNCCTGEKYLLPFLINWFNWPCLIIVVIVILFARYRTQMSIYKLVWEGYKYTHNKE